MENVNVSAIENFLQELPEKALSLGIRIILALVFLFIGVQIIRLIRRLLNKSMVRAGADKGVVQFIDSFVKAALYIVLVFMLASYFGLDAASIVAVVGSAGVAIGLAVQGSLSNLAGGVLILLLKPFKVGDYIMDNAGNEGTVEEIQIFFTRLKTGDNKKVILPNGTLANNSIVNVTAAPTRRHDLIIGISYDSDIKKARDVILKVLEQEDGVLPEQDKTVYVDSLADSAVNLGVRFWVKTDDYWAVKWKATEDIKCALDEAGIQIPFRQVDVNVKTTAQQ